MDMYITYVYIYACVCELMKLILLFMYIIFVRILLYINKVDYVRTNEGIYKLAVARQTWIW